MKISRQHIAFFLLIIFGSMQMASAHELFHGDDQEHIECTICSDFTQTLSEEDHHFTLPGIVTWQIQEPYVTQVDMKVSGYIFAKAKLPQFAFFSRPPPTA